MKDYTIEDVNTEEEFEECRKYMLDRLDEVIAGFKKCREKVINRETLENEDWIPLSQSFRDYMNPQARYNKYLRRK